MWTFLPYFVLKTKEFTDNMKKTKKTNQSIIQYRRSKTYLQNITEVQEHVWEKPGQGH